VGTGTRTKEWQYEFWLDGKFQFKVSIPDCHGKDNEPLPPGTLGSIRKQLHLSREEFARWRDCPIDRKAYERIVRERLGL
jgi:hypothetical protein